MIYGVALTGVVVLVVGSFAAGYRVGVNKNNIEVAKDEIQKTIDAKRSDEAIELSTGDDDLNWMRDHGYLRKPDVLR